MIGDFIVVMEKKEKFGLKRCWIKEFLFLFIFTNIKKQLITKEKQLITKDKMFNSTKIKTKIVVNKFLKTVKKYKPEQVECTPHTFFRLSKAQKEIFTCKELTKILFEERPFLVGIQYNKNYAVFYRFKDRENKALKMILNTDSRKINIVTFYYIEEWQIPKI